MSVLIKHMAMPKGCIYANDKDQTEYCPLLNHDDVPFCQYIENEPEIAIGIDERPVYCPLSDVPESCQDTVSRQAAIDAVDNYIGTFDAIDVNFLDGLKTAKKLMMQLPSAQPDVPESCVGDMISRQEAIEAIVKESHKDGAYGYVDASDATKVLNALPSAERKGHWMKKWHTAFKEELPCCSECNNFMAFRWDYCPNCGARMELE